MLILMVGIRMAVGRAQSDRNRPVDQFDFSIREKLVIGPRVLLLTPVKSNQQEKATTQFVDYAPMIFRKIREAFDISHESYVRSIGPEQLLGNMLLGNLSSLSELSTSGKSGALFFYTSDGRYLLKTVSKREKDLLLEMLPAYYDHMISNPETFLPRFYGLHGLVIKRPNMFGKNVRVGDKYFVVLNNIFTSPLVLHRRFDLKGSWVSRTVLPDKDYNPTIALKDNDFLELGKKIEIGEIRRTKLLEQLRADTDLLVQFDILDYSLLVGVYYVSPSDPDLLTCPSSTSDIWHRSEYGGMMSNDGESIYFCGMIDMLTKYTGMKIVERRVKAVFRDSEGVSVLPPSRYATRFLDFLADNIK